MDYNHFNSSDYFVPGAYERAEIIKNKNELEVQYLDLAAKIQYLQNQLKVSKVATQSDSKKLPLKQQSQFARIKAEQANATRRQTQKQPKTQQEPQLP